MRGGLGETMGLATMGTGWDKVEKVDPILFLRWRHSQVSVKQIL